MVFIVLLVLVVAVATGGALYNSIQRKKLVGNISNISNIDSLPGIEGLPNDASIQSGELGRSAAAIQYQNSISGSLGSGGMS